ncbi:MAG: autotransporter assembly complex family protein [Steroidobacterales bacterium]
MTESRCITAGAAAIVGAAAFLCVATAGWAADPQAYRVSFAATGNSALDMALQSSSQLESLRKSAPVSPFALLERACGDVDRLQAVLGSYGYYQGQVQISIDGRGIGDPGLTDAIAALPAGVEAKVAVVTPLGPLFHLRAVRIEGTLPEGARASLGLAPGAPAVAAEVLEARTRLLTALQEQGYAFAQVDAPIAYEDPAQAVLDVSFKIQAGMAVRIGAIRFTGLRSVNERAARNRLALQVGEPYRASRIEAARQDLLAMGVFAAVSVQLPDKADGTGVVPITFEVQERRRHAVSFTAAYSSDLGGSLGTVWSDRNLRGNAEQLNLSGTAINLGGRATRDLGYDLGAQYVRPGFRQRDQSLQLNVTAIKQDLQAYNQTAATTTALVTRRITPLWSASIGGSSEHERIVQEGVTHDYTLFALPLVGRYDSTGLTNPLLDATRGARFTANITPTESLGHPRATFLVLQASASTYFDLAQWGWNTMGRSVVAWRALVGSAHGAGQFSLPPDQRFYGGSSATVRGYRYQSIGPQFTDGTPIGGTAIDAATMELRQRLWQHLGAAVFVDVGQVTATTQPFQGTLSVGAGAGVRYYTPIGPIRLDVALPTRRPLGGDAFEVYIGLGQAF